MRIGMTVGGEVIGRPGPPGATVEQVRRAEADGFPSAWAVHFSRCGDALTALAVAGTSDQAPSTSGSASCPTYPRHPLALAQQAATAQVFLRGAAHPRGRRVAPARDRGPARDPRSPSPAAHMREYLSVLVPLLREGERASTVGELLRRPTAASSCPARAPVSVLVGGAGAERWSSSRGSWPTGIVTWLAGPRSSGGSDRPGGSTLAAAGRPSPRVVAAIPVAVCDDAGAGHRPPTTCSPATAGSRTTSASLEREGVLVGGRARPSSVTEDAVEAQLRRDADVGVTELWATVFPVGPDPA